MLSRPAGEAGSARHGGAGLAGYQRVICGEGEHAYARTCLQTVRSIGRYGPDVARGAVGASTGARKNLGPTPLARWSDPFNWLPLFPFPPTAPTAADNAIINNGGTAQVVRSANDVARSLILGITPGGSGTVDVRGTLNVGTSIVLGSSTGSSGTLIVQNGGTLTSVLGAIANAPGSQGAATVTGPNSTWTNSSVVVVGGQGAGTLTIANGGKVTSSAGGS